MISKFVEFNISYYKSNNSNSKDSNAHKNAKKDVNIIHNITTTPIIKKCTSHNVALVILFSTVTPLFRIPPRKD